MAEVRKKVTVDKYNTSSIKQNNKNEDVKSNKAKKNNKKTDISEKKNLFTRFMVFCNGVKSEFKKVHWTKKNDMIKYSVAVVIFIIFCSVFFYLIDVLFALIQSLIG